MAVIGKPDRLRCPVAEQCVLGLKLPQTGRVNMPAEMRAHQSVVNLAIDGELLCVCIVQAVFLGAHQHELRCLVELRRRWYPVQPRQAPQVLIRSHTARLIAHLCPLGLRKKGLLGREQAAIQNYG